uniref:Uncharacterized protein n=1 Tax=Siphoviridae sp. ct0Wl9 TaxID=2827763 RepID=A0A8S5T8Y7_9CAUD|nr:MAG TPA: hypothetical protein [Siphoviridae sp. ct0Wl9]
MIATYGSVDIYTLAFAIFIKGLDYTIIQFGYSLVVVAALFF